MTLVIPGFQPVSESDPILVKLMKGVVATCVQSSEDSIAALYGLVQAGPQSTAALAWDMIGRGEASAGGSGNAPLGSSNWAAAAAQLTRLGLPNTAYGPGSDAVANLQATLDSALAQGIPALVGVPRAYNLRDAITGAFPDAGVSGHALDVVGYDPAHGAYIVDDPNSAAAASGGFVEYTLQSLRAAGADSLVIPSGPPGPASGTHLMGLTLPTGGNPLDAIVGADTVFSTVAAWLVPGRFAKLMIGTLLIVVGLIVAFQNETKAVIVGGLQAGAALS